MRNLSICTPLALLLLASCDGPKAAVESRGGTDTEAKSTSSVVDDETVIRGTKLKLVTKGAACVLQAGGAEYLLVPGVPCYFLRRGGHVQDFAYRDAKVDWILIIAGTAINDASRKTWNLSAQEVCGEQSQAVMQKGGKLRISRAIHSGGVYCRDKGVDEKEFWSFAHDPD